MTTIQPQVDSKFNPQFNFELLGTFLPVADACHMQRIELKTTLGERIRLRRTTLKKSQGWLAGLMGVSVNAVSKWEKGGDASLSHLRKLAEHLKCSVGYLAGDQADAKIAEVVRLMEELTDTGREAVFNAVFALHAIQPKKTEAAHRKQA